MNTARDVLIVGSVPLRDAEEVIRTVATTLGRRISRIPDGETGVRVQWLVWQSAVFDRHPLFTRVPKAAKADWRNEQVMKAQRLDSWYALQPGVKAEELHFAPLGYAAAALESYGVFSRLKRAGIVDAATRFQVSIPTPYNVMDQLVAPASRLAAETAYERRMRGEIDEIVAAIPHRELALQWDVAHEVQNLAGARPHWFDDPEQGIIDRLARLASYVPPDVELGYHLCYGDFGHRHIVEPDDTALMVRLANALTRASARATQWIYMPVPRDRSDDAYFAPLQELRTGPETRLYLGLVHLTDGVSGTRQRIDAAKKAIGDFGIATECGFGRRDPATVPAVLQIHAEICDLGL